MKKQILILALCLLLTGCSRPAAEIPVTEAVPSSLPEETAASAFSEPPEEETWGPSEETEEPLAWDAYQVVYNISSDASGEQGVFQGLDPRGNLIWTYETGSYPMAQLPRITPLGRWQDTYYLLEDGTVVALYIPTGHVLFENADFGGCPAEKAVLIDEFGYLYLAGWDRPDFFAMDPQGHTVKVISSLDDQLSGAFRISQEQNTLYVHMERDSQGNSGDFPCPVEMDWLPQAKG